MPLVNGWVMLSEKNPIEFFSRILIKPQYKYTMIDKELILIVECLKLLQEMIFGYETHLYLKHRDLVYYYTPREYKRVI